MSYLAYSYDDHRLLLDEIDCSFDRILIEQDQDNLETVLLGDLHTDVLVNEDEAANNDVGSKECDLEDDLVIDKFYLFLHVHKSLCRMISMPPRVDLSQIDV